MGPRAGGPGGAGRNAGGKPFGQRMDASEYRDEVQNELVRRRLQNVARAATGRPVRVRFGEGAHTDLVGVVQVDPRCRFLFGPDDAEGAPAGDPADRMVMVRGLLEHELCHELHYDRAVFEEMKAEIDEDPEKAPLSRLANVLADCRDEHRHRAFYPRSFELVEAMDALWRERNGTGRWSFRPGSPVLSEVEGALLYRGLPNYALDEGRLGEEALEVYRECRPHLDRAVRGASADVLAGAREILSILIGRGLLADPEDLFRGLPWPFGQARGGFAGNTGGLPAAPLPEWAADAYDAEDREDAPGDAPEDAPEAPTGPQDTPDAGEREANGALDRARREAGLWAGAARSQAPQEPEYADASEEVRRDGSGGEAGDEGANPAPHLAQRRLWAANAQNQKRFASRIGQARVVASAPARFQKRGRLDRRRRRALAVGAEDVFVGRGSSRSLSLAVEVILDVSDSMSGSLDALRASAATISGGLDLAGIAHEVRGFSDHDALPLYRAFGEDPDWRLGAIETVCGTDLWAALPRVRRALSGREEEAKVAVVLTDGATSDPERARADLRRMRREGVTVVGVFLRDPTYRSEHVEGQMRDLFDGAVAFVDDPLSLPALVGGKIAALIKGPNRGAA